MNLPGQVRLVEVGPRDGLQNEKQPISVADKVRLVDDLSAAGLGYIEVGSFVSPKWVPQMAGSAEVFAQIQQRAGVTYAALAPRERNCSPWARSASSTICRVSAVATGSTSNAWASTTGQQARSGADRQGAADDGPQRGVGRKSELQRCCRAFGESGHGFDYRMHPANLQRYVILCIGSNSTTP